MIELPKDIVIEKMVIGHIMDRNDAIFEVLDILNEDVFYDVEHKIIFRTAIECVNNSKVPDSANIWTSNRRISYDYLTSMTGGYVSDFRNKCEILVCLALQRKMITIGERLMRDAQNSDLNPFETNDKYSSELIDALPQITEGNDDMKLRIPEFMKEFEDIQKNGSNGIKTGINSIDRVFSGFLKNMFVLIGARPATGKSAFILNIIEYILSNNHNVGVISLEMDMKEIYDRMLSTTSKVKHDLITQGGATEKDISEVHKYNSSFGGSGTLRVNDRAPLTFGQIRANAIKWKKQHNIDILFIDHIGLISSNSNSDQSMYQNMSKISRDCKLLAKELGIPIVALSQLSRKVDERKVQRPMLSDLKDSGSLEADANVVWFLYNEDEENDANNPTKTVYCECAKNRNGALFKADLIFAKELLKFKDKNEFTNSFAPF